LDLKWPAPHRFVFCEDDPRVRAHLWDPILIGRIRRIMIVEKLKFLAGQQ